MRWDMDGIDLDQWKEQIAGARERGDIPFGSVKCGE